MFKMGQVSIEDLGRWPYLPMVIIAVVLIFPSTFIRQRSDKSRFTVDNDERVSGFSRDGFWRWEI